MPDKAISAASPVRSTPIKRRGKRRPARQRKVSCAICGEGFETRHSQGKYCSEQCKRKGHAGNWAKYRKKRVLSEPQRLAYNAVNAAIKRGDLIPMPCEFCGDSKVDAHHDDYNKPLEVRWVCRVHHREVHGRNLKKDNPDD